MERVAENTVTVPEIVAGNKRQWELRWFVVSSGVVLLIIGLAKVWSALGQARALDVADPIIGILFRHLMLWVGLLELFIAFFCLFTDKRQFSLLTVAWLAMNFLVYRLGRWRMGWHRPCRCLGNLTDLLHLSPRNADNGMWPGDIEQYLGQV